jgi:hypothetical protein
VIGNAVKAMRIARSEEADAREGSIQEARPVQEKAASNFN